jgi:hypothetical protein
MNLLSLLFLLLVVLHLITPAVFGEKCIFWSSSWYFPHTPVTFSLFDPNTLLRNLFSDTRVKLFHECLRKGFLCCASWWTNKSVLDITVETLLLQWVIFSSVACTQRYMYRVWRQNRSWESSVLARCVKLVQLKCSVAPSDTLLQYLVSTANVHKQKPILCKLLFLFSRILNVLCCYPAC